MTMEQPPIEIGRVLSNTFGLMGRRAGTLCALGGLVILPTRLLTWQLVRNAILPATPDVISTEVTFWLGLFAISALATIMLDFGQAAMIGASMAQREDRSMGLLETLAPALRRLPFIMLAGLLHFVGFMIGFVLLLVPGCIVMTMWSVVGPVMGAEQTGVIQSFRRSMELTRGTRWQVFWLLMFVGIGEASFNWVIQHFGRRLVETRATDLTYAVEPNAFALFSLVALLVAGFSMALHSTLYIALIDRHGDGPVNNRLAHIFA
jgi:hypothetical protein